MTLDDTVRPLLAQLTLAYGQKYGQTASSAADLVATWVRVLADCEARDVTSAVDQWLRTQRAWPAPSDIREAAWAHTRRRRPVALSDNAFCRRCHARDLVELPNGRFMPHHSDNCPGLHESDALDLRHAVETGRAIWRNGAPLKPTVSSP